MASIATAKAHKKLTLNMFISRDAIEAWASHLDLRIVDVRGAYDRFVPLPEPVVLDSGRGYARIWVSWPVSLRLRAPRLEMS
jgi:hypothetical protein